MRNRQARRREQGQGRAHPPTGGVIHRMLALSGRSRHQAFSKRGAFAGMMDALGRTLRGDMTIARTRSASLILFQSHRMAALQRPRTEARPRRVDNTQRNWLIEARYRSEAFKQQWKQLVKRRGRLNRSESGFRRWCCLSVTTRPETRRRQSRITAARVARSQKLPMAKHR